MNPVIRRVHTAEWRQVKALRLEAVQDPDAAVAFLEDYATTVARDDAFWRLRAAGAAMGSDAAQFIAEVGHEWVGTVTVLRSDPVTFGFVGVYLAPAMRGTGLIEHLFAAGSAWAEAQGARRLTLTVHVDNPRAQRVYTRLGFVDTGERIPSPIGMEITMQREIAAA